ncbi:MAG: hypothetical protein RIB60_07540 [Phycisphaerales bacterium]
MTNGRRKGKEGELEIVNELKKHGVHDARRTVQHSGIEGQIGDVVCPETFPRLHFEVKRLGNISLGTKPLEDALDQAERDRPKESFPVVCWRADGTRVWKMSWRCPSLGHTLTVYSSAAIVAACGRLNEQTGDL